MALTPGTRLGVFQLTGLIGRGGMGEVYRARDTKLDRSVAIKILPEAFAHDASRLARFVGEAKTLASLNHPNIAAIYGLEESNGVKALVMELVEGDDLSRRIARGAIPVDEALPIARQIAEALEAAHEQGIVHRDLKPANIKLRSDGTVKVLDFGLAKAMDPAGAMAASISMAPTTTTPALMTGPGMILGTAAYMSPEQARGKAVDKRADIWAFGAVLFEMLAGKRAFPGEEVAEVLGAVIHKEPAWSQLPDSLPTSLRTTLRRCLEKDLRQRFRDIGDVRLTLDGVFDPVPSETRLTQSRASGWWGRRAVPLGAIALAVFAGSVGWSLRRPPEIPPPLVSRLTISLPNAPVATSSQQLDLNLAISPDGSRIAYVGNGGTQLFVRGLNAFEPVAVFSGDPRGPFFSPDGQWIGFVNGNSSLMKVAVNGGPPVNVASLAGLAQRGATWAPDDTIIFAEQGSATGLLRVPAAGGPTTVLTRPDRAQGEEDHLWPELLPDGRSVLFTVTSPAGGADASQIVVMDLRTGVRKTLARGGSNAHYVTTGHLIYAAGGALRAVLFDLSQLEVRGAAVSVIPDVQVTLAGAVQAVMAVNGTLVYLPGNGQVFKRTAVWVDRQGRETPLPVPPQRLDQPRVSPDGTRAAIHSDDGERDIWLLDFARTTLTRFTFDRGLDHYPVWTPDGRRLLFSSQRGVPDSVRNLFWQAADGTGEIARLTTSPILQHVTSVSPDGRIAVFTEFSPRTGEDIMQLDMTSGEHRVAPLIQSMLVERNGIISPDGRWLAYEADDSGRFEIYTRPFPDVGGGRWQVSTAGGKRPVWARNGQELFYASPTGAVMGVGVERGSAWIASTPGLIVKEGYYTNPSGPTSGPMFDISADGKRFLLIKDSAPDVVTQYNVVQHFDVELKRLVPAQ
ncbi:MAG: protein kinase [Acidobacteria bacterium]|nr:protein kinase [Acidobacteriota bacterium]